MALLQLRADAAKDRARRTVSRERRGPAEGGAFAADGWTRGGERRQIGVPKRKVRAAFHGVGWRQGVDAARESERGPEFQRVAIGGVGEERGAGRETGAAVRREGVEIEGPFGEIVQAVAIEVGGVGSVGPEQWCEAREPCGAIARADDFYFVDPVVARRASRAGKRVADGDVRGIVQSRDV